MYESAFCQGPGVFRFWFFFDAVEANRSAGMAEMGDPSGKVLFIT
jgi:hypothetical protein